MSSALRLGLSRPAAAAASRLVRPQSTAVAAAAAAHALPSIDPSPEEILATPDFSPPTKNVKALKTFKTIKTGLPKQGTPLDQFGNPSPLPIPKQHARDAHIPVYPYGPRRVYHQSNFGLYGLSRIQFGNNVSEKHNVKTHRVWRLNVQRKKLWSMALRCWVQTKVTPRVIRTIDKSGGLDNYLLGEKPMRIKELGPWGWKLRWRIMQTDVVKKRFRDERAALGLPPKLEDQLEEELLREMQSAEAMEAMHGSDAAEEPEMWTEEEEALMAEMDEAAKTEMNRQSAEAVEEDPFMLEAPVVAKDEGFMKEEARP